MPPKNKKKKSNAKKEESSDFDDILNEFGAAPPAPTTASTSNPTEAKDQEPKAADTTSADDAAAAYLASMGLTEETGGAEDKKKKKKKGKKKPAAKQDEKKPSAAAKLLLERQAAIKAEEERLEKLRQEELAIEMEKERQEKEAEQKRLEQLQRKKDAKKAKIEKQKKEGTYMTKAEKQKAAKAKAALEAMQKAGLVIGGATSAPKKPVYSDKRKKSKQPIKEEKPKGEVLDAKPEEEKEAKEDESSADVKEPILDSWEDDDWECDDLVAKLSTNLEQVAVSDDESDNEVEDLLLVEQKAEQERLRLQGLERLKREEEARNAEDDDEESHRSQAQIEADQRKMQAKERRSAREEAARAAVSTENLRSPICCIMGHVDTGKTKLLDNIRRTNVQDGEAGGITQQIGATFFPVDALKAKTKLLTDKKPMIFKLPGLLVIDTPGHESFTNLRSRGSSLCDIAILVVDIMHGLEPQTLESLRLLRSKKAPFVVALNKIDRCYGWKTCPDMPIQDALKLQNEHVIREFEDRAAKVKVEFMEQGLNAELYWRNDDLGRTISLVPTSAITGEGVSDILMLLTRLAQERMAKSLAYVDILQCTVLEVKVIEGLGTTVDVILVNGSLSEGDRVVVCTLDGPVVTTIRSLLTPHPMKEIRVKGEYIHHPTIKAAMGVKICAQGLEKAVAGTPVYVVGPDDDEEELKDDVMTDLTSIMQSISSTKRGVIVQASTLGALEALLQFLSKECKPPIPVSGVNIGPVHKRDVVRASVQLEHQPEYATILAFDVKVNHDAEELAAESRVRIFTADIIYHLFDQFTAYMEQIKAERRAQFADIAVFPVVLRILPDCIFNKKDPILLGVEIEEGILKVGTPLVVPQLGNLLVGRVTSIERDHKEVELARKSQSVCVRIQSDSNVAFGRHFEAKHKLYSLLTRESIDALKANFKDDLSKDDWRTVIKMKKVFDII